MHKYLILLLLPVLLAVLCACRREVPLASSPSPTASTGETGSLINEEAQLIASAATPEEAQEIADLYGITLVEHKRSFALYRTEEDPKAVIQRGRDNGWPELNLNYIMKPF